MEGEDRFDKLAGGVLMFAGAGGALLMAHHPLRGSAGGTNTLVHGGLIALLGAATWGFAHMAVRRGLDRPAPLAGLVAWSIALFANIGAATIIGFASPALATHADAGPGVFAFAWKLNQALARLAVVTTGVAFVLWAHGWMLRPQWWARLVGVHGVVLGVVPMVLLATGMEMNVAGATTIYSMHLLWIAMVGLYFWSGRFAHDAISRDIGL
jgi:hypothetical protein